MWEELRCGTKKKNPMSFPQNKVVLLRFGDIVTQRGGCGTQIFTSRSSVVSIYVFFHTESNGTICKPI